MSHIAEATWQRVGGRSGEGRGKAILADRAACALAGPQRRFDGEDSYEGAGALARRTMLRAQRQLEGALRPPYPRSSGGALSSRKDGRGAAIQLRRPPYPRRHRPPPPPAPLRSARGGNCAALA